MFRQAQHSYKRLLKAVPGIFLKLANTARNNITDFINIIEPFNPEYRQQGVGYCMIQPKPDNDL